jgi:hypothetical protein
MSKTGFDLIETDSTIDALLSSEHPSIRYKTRVNVLGESPASPSIKALRAQITESVVVRKLLRHQQTDGRIAKPERAYAKWQGTHWIAAALADLGYPPGDRRLLPLRDQLQASWLRETFYREFSAETKASAYRSAGVPVMQGRHRRCASQQSNALWSILKLGLANSQTHDFVERLLHWQWPDGGWNCDKNPAASHSSFMESILPLRALALYAQIHDDKPAAVAAARAKEIFLKRNLFLRESDGSVMKKEFVCLHYPLYWHYDFLHGLKILAEAGFIRDRRCEPALQLLADKQLPAGGWPAEKKYYRTSDELALGNDFVDWGPTGKTRLNLWTTVDALYVFRAAGYLSL